MSLSTVLEISRADLGYTENPSGSNRAKYWNACNPKINTKVNSIGDSW